MIDVIGGEEFIDGSQILLVEHFLVETVNSGLILFGGHPRNSFQGDTPITLLINSYMFREQEESRSKAERLSYPVWLVAARGRYALAASSPAP